MGDGCRFQPLIVQGAHLDDVSGAGAHLDGGWYGWFVRKGQRSDARGSQIFFRKGSGL